MSSEYIRKKEHTVALSDVSFTVKDGEFAVIIGPSGCGKSTLLKCLLGFQDYGGEILLSGSDIEKTPLASRHIGYVSQTRVLYSTMTVFDNIAFPMKVAHYDESAIRSRIARMSSLLDLDLLLTRKPRQLSGGQQQRVALARALVGFSSILLLDEPFSDLDHPSKVELWKVLKMLRKELGLTILFVTHDPQEATALADELIVMDHGMIVEKGSLHDIVSSPSPLTFELLGGNLL